MKQITQKLNYFLTTAVLISGFSLVFLAPTASAAGLFGGAKKQACAGVNLSGPATNADCTAQDEKNLSSTVQKGINLVSLVVGIIAVIMIILGSLRYIVSNGDSSKITSARNTIIYAIVGLILATLAQVIVRFVIANA